MLLDSVVVGRGFHSLLKSYTEKIPMVLVNHDSPTIDLKLSDTFHIENLSTVRELEAWQMLKFLCSMEGLIVNPNPLSYLRMEEDTLRFNGGHIQFKKCHLFSCPDLKTDLPIVRIDNDDLYRVLDFMRLKICNASNIDTIFPKDTFIDKIECFGKKEVVAVSTLSKEQLTTFDYSDTIVRFITQKVLLSSNGLHRPLISKDSERRRNPILTVLERSVVPISETVYRSSRKVKYYDRKKRDDIFKAYCRDNTCI